MLKFLLAAAPYFLKTPGKNSKKQIARSFTALVLFAFSGFALVAAMFIYVTSLYGAALGFVSVSLVLFAMGIGLYLKAKWALTQSSKVPAELAPTKDPIASIIPDSIIQEPTVKKLLNRISANPISTSVGAAAIGVLLAREILKD
ncbi:MAG: hypothetical protein HKN36_04070 [Hellea sp.]|nr:hypothetical protein [Hellea sp.]